MPYPVQQLIEGRGLPETVSRDDTVQKALSVMIEHDYSQLPVVDADGRPLGMVTHEGILRGVRNFKVRLEELHVRVVMVDAPTFNLEDDLFDLLAQLKQTNAVLIVDPFGQLAGIVTSYDSTEYFRNRAEDLMHVEDIEVMVKDFIRLAYADDNGEVNEGSLALAISRLYAKVADQEQDKKGEKPKPFDDLSLGEYIALLVSRHTWEFFEGILKMPRDAVREILEAVRNTRNALAHFRTDISADQRDQLQFCADWLARCQEEYQEAQRQEWIQSLIGQPEEASELIPIESTKAEEFASLSESPLLISKGDEIHRILLDEIQTLLEGSKARDSRYAPLADWLQSQPGNVDRAHLTFNDIEKIIEGDLPPSARSHRAWWANDSTSHPHSRLWLEIGWRTTYVNLTEERVTFARIREREKQYIDYYSALLADLRQKADFPIKDRSPDGASWITIAGLPKGGPEVAWFNYSFSRNNRFRVELYIDLYDQEKTKAVYDKLFYLKDKIEEQLGPLSWERISRKRASRIALYHAGAITDDEKSLKELRHWAVETLTTLYHVLGPLAERAIREVLG